MKIDMYLLSASLNNSVSLLYRGGELLDRLQMQKGHQYSEKIACHYIHTMLSAVAYCHAHSIVHRDLKLENFLFESEAQDSELKLIGKIYLCLLNVTSE